MVLLLFAEGHASQVQKWGQVSRYRLVFSGLTVLYMYIEVPLPLDP